ncbi:hypothetical protein CKM354_000422600 [Cercospora kikuchii]|uniref:Uncharacterized protein n=1 Tax=Cercospora kikuchii TaxID=84275 RepID=A0A9P3FB44_9PEZI|nr:uncharacterized protein CKM354_000422600 [Cercospora kikuchii]GIZ40906.1 hypothetical protein CKM354_000422600 [Cercospora kikuchii]
MDARRNHGNLYDTLQFSGDRPQIRLLRLLDPVPPRYFDDSFRWGDLIWSYWEPVEPDPLQEAEPLEYELAVYDFDAAPAYDAVSYVWAQEIHGGGSRCRFLVGGRYFSLLDLKNIREAASKTPNSFARASPILELFSMQAKERSDAMSDMPQLGHAGFLLCADPRDRVYGTLGLHQYGREKDIIVPDYDKSVFDLALDLSRSGRISFLGLQHSAEALEIKFHNTRLLPYLVGCSLEYPACSTEVQEWQVRFSVCRIIDEVDPLELQDVMKIQRPLGPDLTAGKHEACVDPDTNDLQGFKVKCDRLLQEKQVIKGVAASKHINDEWVVPATARVGDIILSAMEKSVGGWNPNGNFLKTSEDFALVVRIGPAAEITAVLGFATCMPASERVSKSGSVSDLESDSESVRECGSNGRTTLARWDDSLWDTHVIVYFEATVEEMMPLAIPQRDAMLHARHAFKVPKCAAFLADRGDYDLTLTQRWLEQDGQEVLNEGE